MPQSSEELRSKWGGYNGIGEDKAEGYLIERGWRLRRDWQWEKPTPDHEPTDEEWDAIQFLFEEWDYGGVVEEGKPLEFLYGSN